MSDMNRHTRRAIGKNKRLVASLGGISDAAEKLQPLMTQIDELKVELANAAELLRETRQENAAIALALSTQQELYFRLFAQGMGVSLDTIVSMAGEIQAQLTEGQTHGIKNFRTTASEEDTNDPGP